MPSRDYKDPAHSSLISLWCFSKTAAESTTIARRSPADLWPFIADFGNVVSPRTPSLTSCSVSWPGAHHHVLALPIGPGNHRRPGHQELTSARRSSSRHPAPFQEEKDLADPISGFVVLCSTSSTSPSPSRTTGVTPPSTPVRTSPEIHRRNPSLWALSPLLLFDRGI
jgi:hypothetical protein